MSGKVKNLIGCVFGRLTVISFHGVIKGNTHWNCQCSCEARTVKRVSIGNLTKGTTKSCGCLRIAISSESHITHSLSQSKEYNIWERVKRRCFNKNEGGYKYYGGRGITMHLPWVKDAEAFIKYIKNLANFGVPGVSLDRINNDGNYEPGNLRWATSSQQAANRRTSLTLMQKQLIEDRLKNYCTSKNAIARLAGCDNSTVLAYSKSLSIQNMKRY